MTAAITEVGTAQGAYVANHASTVATTVVDPTDAANPISLNMPEPITGTAPAHVVAMDAADATKLKMESAAIKKPAAVVAGSKGDLATKTSAESTTLGNRNTAEAAAKLAFDIKETLLTAYCVQSIAWGVALADMKAGKEPSADYQMGHGGRTTDSGNSAISYYTSNPPKYDYASGGSTGAAPQLGVLTAGSADDVYRCTIPTKGADNKINNAPTLGTGVTVLKPGDNTTNSARLLDCANDFNLKAVSAACTAKSTHCKFAGGACSEDATKTVLLNKPAFAKALADALALADPQCLAKKLKSDSTDELVYKI